MRYLQVLIDDIDYQKCCIDCINNVVNENLISNGGTLFIPNAVFYSDTLILACDNDDSIDNIIGFVALNTYHDQEIYINQIVVKNNYKRRGVGTELINYLKTCADTKDITCDVKDSNKASQALFEGCDFIKDEKQSNNNDYFYRHKALIKTKQMLAQQ